MGEGVVIVVSPVCTSFAYGVMDGSLFVRTCCTESVVSVDHGDVRDPTFVLSAVLCEPTIEVCVSCEVYPLSGCVVVECVWCCSVHDESSRS